MMVTVKPTTYGEFVLFVSQLSPLPAQECYRSAQRIHFIHGNVLEWEKRVDLNFWISSRVDVYNYIILLMLSIYFHHSQSRLHWGGASIINVDTTSATPYSIANPECFCFCAASPSSLFFAINCCWSSSIEEGIVFVLSLVIPLLCLPKKTLEQGGAELQHMWGCWEPTNPTVGLGNEKDCERVIGPKNLKQ